MDENQLEENEQEVQNQSQNSEMNNEIDTLKSPYAGVAENLIEHVQKEEQKEVHVLKKTIQYEWERVVDDLHKFIDAFEENMQNHLKELRAKQKRVESDMTFLAGSKETAEISNRFIDIQNIYEKMLRNEAVLKHRMAKGFEDVAEMAKEVQDQMLLYKKKVDEMIKIIGAFESILENENIKLEDNDMRSYLRAVGRLNLKLSQRIDVQHAKIVEQNRILLNQLKEKDERIKFLEAKNEEYTTIGLSQIKKSAGFSDKKISISEGTPKKKISKSVEDAFSIE